MGNQLCFQCFRVKGDYEVCPWCGYTGKNTENQAYQLMPGTILNNRYIIGTTLGIGGFGITYKAYDTVLSIVVAIKEFYPARLVNRGANEQKVGIFSGEKREEYDRLLKRFQIEAQNMAMFSREPDIVNIFDSIEANNTAYIIMEYIEGVLLKDELAQNGKMPSERATEYVISILNALEKIHYHGLVHKDISPDNIFLIGKNGIKLADFGASRLQGTKTSEETEAIVKVGYAPPEQYQAGSEQGAFMDIYGAAAVYYEMLTGVKPQDAMDRQIEDLLKSPKECGIDLDSRLDRIVMKAMAVDYHLRFQTVEQMKKAIVGKKKVDLPEEELRKRKWLRRLTGAGAAAMAAVSLTVLVLSQTVFSGKGKIDVSKIEKTAIEVWLESDQEKSGERLAKVLKEDMQEKCPQATLKLEVIPSSEYEARLEEALKEKNLPDVFCTSRLPEGEAASKHCIKLDKLLNTLDLSDYLFFREMKKKKVYELPTALQVGVVYVNESKEKKIPKSIDKEKLLSEKAVFQYGDEPKAYQEFQNKKSKIKWIAGDLSSMEAVKEVTVNQIPPTDFQVVPLLEEDKLTGCLVHCYGVDKSADQNEQEAAMVALSLLVNDRLQSAAYMDNEEGIPLNKTVYEDYQEYKMTTYLAFLKNYQEKQIIIQKKDICQYLRQQEQSDKTEGRDN